MLNEKQRGFLRWTIYQIYPRSFMDSNGDGSPAPGPAPPPGTGGPRPREAAGGDCCSRLAGHSPAPLQIGVRGA